MADEERTEDLNPRSEDIDEKIRRMLDPSVPDDSNDTSKKHSSTKPKISGVSGAVPETLEASQTAPELPSKTPKSKKSSAKTGAKKIIIPIDHNDDAAETEAESAAEEKPVRKITVADGGETTGELAEKLNKTIAGLDASDKKPKPVGKKKKPAKENIEEEPASDPVSDESSAEPADSPESSAEDELAQDEERDTDEDEIDAAEEEATTAPPLTAKPKPDIVPITKPDLPAPDTDTIDKAEAPLPDATALTDPETEKAVEQIISQEGDALLEADDTVRKTKTFEPATTKKQSRRSGWLGRLLRKGGFWKFVLFLVIVGGIAAGLTPRSRYYILNTAGVRASTSLTILDNTTGQPLKDVQITAGGRSGKTDETGNLTLAELRLGETKLKIEKLAFATVERNLIIGWGSNKLGEVRLDPTGEQYEFVVTDYLSGKPVIGAEASTDESGAVSNKDGVIKLTIRPSEAKKLVIKIAAKDYRTETLNIDPANKGPHKLKLVPARKHAYILKEGDRYNIYSEYVDGKERKVVVGGTGHERDDLMLLPHPAANIAAYVSTRANKLSSAGNLLNDLIILDLGKNDTTSVVAKERLQLVGWSGDRLVYVEVKSAADSKDPKRSRLVSYNYQDGSTKELATSNYFNDLTLARSVVYFAPSSAYPGGSAAEFFQVNPDGTGQKTLLKQEVWNFVRSTYNQLVLSVGQNWYDYRLGETQPKKLEAAPSSKASRIYIDGPGGKHSAWVNMRAGKGSLLVHDTSTGDDKTLHAQVDLKYPISWLNAQTIVFRIDDDQETADYAVSLQGGKPVKIADVTATDTKDAWYYY